MLVLTPKDEEIIKIDGGITIEVVRSKTGQLRLGITAPDLTNIWREKKSPEKGQDDG